MNRLVMVEYYCLFPVEHVFEIIVEGVRGLEFENMIWGEADCFVQYSFLSQNAQTDASREGEIKLKNLGVR